MDTAMREMTADEWAATLVGADQERLAVALKAAEQRGRRQGQKDLCNAAHHFEVAYRYAVNANRPGEDSADLLASAEIMARIGYDELQKANRS